MTVVTALLILIALELLAAVTALAWTVVKGCGVFPNAPKGEEAGEPDEAKRQAEKLEKAWSDGVNSILGFDMKTAGEAMKRYGEKDRE